MKNADGSVEIELKLSNQGVMPEGKNNSKVHTKKWHFHQSSHLGYNFLPFFVAILVWKEWEDNNARNEKFVEC